MLYSGIDLHKRTCAIVTLDARGRMVDTARIATDRYALAGYFRRHRKPHTAVVEATGSWHWLHDFLKAEGIAPILAHAKYLKAIAYAKVKTDAIDARTLAQLLRAEFIPEAHMVSPELRPLRDLMRARLLLVQKHVSARSSIQRPLEIDGIERFPSDRHFFSYCRLVPGADNSAGKTRHRTSKDGNRYLKIVFAHAAVRAIQYYPEIRAFAQKKAHKKNKHIARAVVAKEIARIVYHILKEPTDFNGTFKGKVLTRTKQTAWPRRASPLS